MIAEKSIEHKNQNMIKIKTRVVCVFFAFFYVQTFNVLATVGLYVQRFMSGHKFLLTYAPLKSRNLCLDKLCPDILDKWCP